MGVGNKPPPFSLFPISNFPHSMRDLTLQSILFRGSKCVLEGKVGAVFNSRPHIETYVVRVELYRGGRRGGESNPLLAHTYHSTYRRVHLARRPSLHW